jgi:hypothetical protein
MKRRHMLQIRTAGRGIWEYLQIIYTSSRDLAKEQMGQGEEKLQKGIDCKDGIHKDLQSVVSISKD